MYRSKKIQSTEVQAEGQDSFLDVVANIVGILIILTAIVGGKIQHNIISQPVKTASLTEEKDEQISAVELSAANETEPIPAAPSEAQKLQAAQLNQEIGMAVSELQSIESEISDLNSTLVQVESQNQMLAKEKDAAARATEEAKKELERKRALLSDKEKEKFDLQNKAAEKAREIEQTENNIGYEISQKKPNVKKLECYPTAISRPVDKSEVWLQIKGGRIANIPSERLVEAFRQKVTSPGNSKSIYDGGRVNVTVGPFDGFFLEGEAWTEDRRKLSVDLRFIPLSEQVGETVDEAMERMDSAFLSQVRKYDPRTTVITIWVYEDSFLEFQEIEKYLYDSGFRVASRPLPNGAPIGAGPNGSRSAAQ